MSLNHTRYKSRQFAQAIAEKRPPCTNPRHLCPGTQKPFRSGDSPEESLYRSSWSSGGSLNGLIRMRWNY